MEFQVPIVDSCRYRLRQPTRAGNTVLSASGDSISIISIPMMDCYRHNGEFELIQTSNWWVYQQKPWPVGYAAEDADGWPRSAPTITYTYEFLETAFCPKWESIKTTVRSSANASGLEVNACSETRWRLLSYSKREIQRSPFQSTTVTVP